MINRMKQFLFNTIPYMLGTSARENWTILSRAEPDHWWVHLDEYPSAHVIVCTDIPLDAEELAYARQLILEQTPKAPRSARCIYAQVRWVKRGDVPGEVIVKPGHEKRF